jgi:hypothetical protein
VERTFDGGPVRYSVRLDRAEIDLAGELLLEEVLEVDAGFAAELPADLVASFDGLAVTATEGPRTEQLPDGGTRTTRRLVLEPQRTGDVKVRERSLWFHEAGAATESELQAGAQTVTVAPPPADLVLGPPEPRSIFVDDPEPPATSTPLWVWVVAGAALLTLAAAAAWWLRRREVVVPARPPHEVALAALARLGAAGPFTPETSERFFIDLSAVLRTYLEDRFGIEAPERTTEELLSMFDEEPALAAGRDTVAGFFALADRIKFAASTSDPETMDRALGDVRAFVEATAAEDPTAGAPEATLRQATGAAP